MVKYYGERSAKVGRYRSEKLGASFSTEEFLEKWGDDPTLDSPAKDIKAYLSRAGSFVSLESNSRGQHLFGSCVHHFAGATVVVNYNFDTKLSISEDAGTITVRLASNEPIESLIERLCKRFSYLQKNRSYDGID